jgi:hypothetical protein
VAKRSQYEMKILFLILILVFEANASFALECWARRTVSEELKHSTIVFSGKAVAEEYSPIINAAWLARRRRDIGH